MKKTVSDEKRFIAIATVILVVISIVALFPMILLVVASFTDENELITNGYQILPKKLSLEAYTYMVKQAATIVRSYLVTIGTRYDLTTCTCRSCRCRILPVEAVPSCRG